MHTLGTQFLHIGGLRDLSSHGTHRLSLLHITGPPRALRNESAHHWPVSVVRAGPTATRLLLSVHTTAAVASVLLVSPTAAGLGFLVPHAASSAASRTATDHTRDAYCPYRHE